MGVFGLSRRGDVGRDEGDNTPERAVTLKNNQQVSMSEREISHARHEIAAVWDGQRGVWVRP